MRRVLGSVVSVALFACSGGSETGEPAAGSIGAGGTNAMAGTAGSAGKSAAGASGGAGASGATAGTAGAAATAAGVGGSAGTAAASGGSGAMAGGAGASGTAGVAASGGAAGSAGMTAGVGGTAGASGTAGAGGASCKDTCKDGVCIGEVCCAEDLACGTVCCNAGTVCSFGKCVMPGKDCSDSDDCAPDEYCDFALGAAGSGGGAAGSSGMCFVNTKKGKCLPEPPTCAPGSGGSGGSPTCIEACEVKPSASAFDPVVKYSWTSNGPPYTTDVMMAPIVIQLDDDNCDGKVNENDIPEIVFSTFANGAYYKQGTIHAISIVGGQVVEKWSRVNMVQPGGGLAGGDLDGDGVPEVVGCMNPGPHGNHCCDELAQNTGVIAFRADGSTFWTQTDTSQVHCGYDAPSIADLDADGNPEVIVGWTILDGKTGAVKKNLAPDTSWGVKLTSVADLDGDGKLDVTDGQRAFRADGSVLWDLRSGTNAITRGYNAVGDLDKDGKPEVVVVSSAGPHAMHIVSRDPVSPGGAKVIRKGLDINNGISTAVFCGAGYEYGGGPPTIADFDGDGYPDVGAAGAVGYIVFSGKKLMDGLVPDSMTTLWFKTTHDCSSAVTGSSVFDFNGDGKAEVIYGDEYHLWMYDGPTGMNLIPSTCNTNGTLWEYPVIADVDNDGQADIVVGANAYALTCPDNGSKQSGIRVFGSASNSWVKTRRIWNQHTYHITNINEDGSVPKVEQPNWKVPGLNNYRQNKQPGLEFAAPDVVITKAKPVCFPTYALTAVVTNLGQAVLPKGVSIGFYKGTPPSGTLLGTAQTTEVLYPAQSEVVTIATSDADVKNGSTPFYVVADAGGAPHPSWTECRPNNNTFGPVSGVCKQ